MSLFRGLTSVAAFLPALAHEMTHYAASKPWADDVELELSLTEATAVTRVRWTPDAPRAVRVFAHLAPTIMGFGGGALVSAYWALNGFTLPEGADTWARLALACVVWCVYTAPSPHDVQGAIDQ